MKVRNLIVGVAVLAGCAATTFAGERRIANDRDHRDVDRHEVFVRHDDRDDHRDRVIVRDGFRGDGGPVCPVAPWQCGR